MASLKRKNLFLLTTLPLLFISDILYGLMQFNGYSFPITPGVIIRGMLLSFAAWVVISQAKYANKKEVNWLILLILLALPGLLTSITTSKDYIYDISAIAKILYVPVIFIFFLIYFKKLKASTDDIMTALESSAYVLGVAMLTPLALGIRTETYGSYAFGSTGIFHAQNDLTLAFGLALLAAAYRLTFVRFSLIRLTFFMLSLYACLQIGTNASLLVPVITLSVLLAIYIKSSNSLSIQSSLVKLSLLSILMIGALYFFFQTLDIFISHDYQSRKIEALLAGEFSRAPLTHAAEQYIARRSYLFDLFGEGYDSFHRGVAMYFPTYADRRMVESDPYDIFGAQGIFFVSAIYLFLVRFIFISIRSSLFSNKSDIYLVIAGATFLYICYSILVGHALTSPIPSTLLAAYLALIYVVSYES